MIREKEIYSSFDKGRYEELMSWATQQDAIGFNYQDKCRWFLNQLRDIHGRILDVGCNVGNLPFLFRQWGVSARQVHFTGIDIAAGSIDLAKKRNIPGTTFQIGSILNIKFPDNTFDGVMCMEVIQYVPYQAKAMREMARVLKPDGILVLSTPNSECKTWLLDERIRFFAWSVLGRKLVDKRNPLTLTQLKKRMIENNLTPLERTQYYWYRPYHIFKGHLWWPPRLALKGLLAAMKECKEISENGQLTEEQERFCCNNILAVARKRGG